jgi:hypothetical protein
VRYREEKSTSAPGSTFKATPAACKRSDSSAASGPTRERTFSYTPSMRCGVATTVSIPSSARPRQSATDFSQSRGPSSMPGRM